MLLWTVGTSTSLPALIVATISTPWVGRTRGRTAAAVLFVLRRRCVGGGHLAVLGRRGHAPTPVLVEDEHGRATLEARVATLAGPVTVA